MAAVVCHNLSKSFGAVRALSEVSFELPEQRVLLILGPSGAGKTTLLRLIAGLDRPDTGTIEVCGEFVTGPTSFAPPHKRRLALLFQRPTLWPHLTAIENVSLALAGKRLSRAERRAAAARALAELGMAGREKAWPGTLSGGELQRVALARALVTQPDVLLLDEPFASLDISLRKDLSRRLRDLKTRKGVAMVWVSHRYEEAFALADHLILLRDGLVVESGECKRVLAAPKSAFAAEFLNV